MPTLAQSFVRRNYVSKSPSTSRGAIVNPADPWLLNAQGCDSLKAWLRPDPKGSTERSRKSLTRGLHQPGVKGFQVDFQPLKKGGESEDVA